MSDDVTRRLRQARGLKPVELALLLGELLGRPFGQLELIGFFKSAFPGIPLGILMKTKEWRYFRNGELSDNEFNELLAPYLPDSEPTP